MFSSFSRKTYIRSPRSVTLTPTGMPWRSLKLEMLFLALVMIGFCRAISESSLTALSMALESSLLLPSPSFSTILVMRGTAMTLV